MARKNPWGRSTIQSINYTPAKAKHEAHHLEERVNFRLVLFFANVNAEKLYISWRYGTRTADIIYFD